MNNLWHELSKYVNCDNEWLNWWIDLMFDMEWRFGEQNILLLFHLDWNIMTK